MSTDGSLPEPAAAEAPDTAAAGPDAFEAGPGHAAEADRSPGAQQPAGPPSRAPGTRRLVASTVLLVGVAVVFGAGVLTGRATAPGAPVGEASTRPGGSGAAAVASPSPATLPSNGPRLGDPGAPVVVDYWADYQCPFCARFAEQAIPALRSRIEDGTVLLVHRDFAFLGPESLDAAVAVRCAAREGRYWQMHDAVYEGQVGENQGAFSRARLARIAGDVGLDAAAFEACLDDREPLVDVLDDTAAGIRSGISSTPTTIVNGRRFMGVPDIDTFLEAIDAAAAGASPMPAPTPAPTDHAWSGVTTSGREAGDPAAPVTVELWMDYQSPEAPAVAQTLGPELRTRIAAGEIRAVLRDLALLGEESVTAGAFVTCVAGQDGPAWLVHDVLAAAGRGADSGLFTAPNLLRFASQLGLDVRALNACLEADAAAEAVRGETAVGTAAGLGDAPVVVVRRGGTELGRFAAPLDVAAIAAALDAAR